MKLLAKTFQGLESVLAKELIYLGAKNVEEGKRSVSFTGDQKMLYKANLHLSTALSILKPIATFTAQDEETLYRNVKSTDWSKYMDPEGTFVINSTVRSPYFRHSQYAALKTKDAIVDQFRNRYRQRPSIDKEQPDIRINLHINRDVCTLSLDSSCVSLHKRGYRVRNHRAPINEVLAAGMIRLSGWNGRTDFYDPMCGSGTLLIEAGFFAKKMAPGLLRTYFGFMNWKDFDIELWESLRQKALSQVEEIEIGIKGSDQSLESIKMARENAMAAGLEEVTLSKKDFADCFPKKEEGILISNPPYGERLTNQNMINMYKKIGDHLKKSFTGFDAWFISSNKEAMKSIGLRTSKKWTLYNGPLECKFHGFALYRGSKKASKQTQND